MEDKLKQLWLQAQSEIASANPANYEILRTKYLGRKSELNHLLGQIADLPIEQKAVAGQLGNQIKQQLAERLNQLAERQPKAEVELFDPTIPGLHPPLGRLHPLTQTTNELVKLFRGLGFSVADGPEVETEENNFNLLNIPDNHPARDAWDTFWLKESVGSKFNPSADGQNSKFLLRTHTSPVQIRYMKEHRPPIRIIAPGRTFRYEAEDATHSSVFYQLEGLLIDRGITVAHLKAVIDTMVKGILGSEVKTRLRPSFFPFTEPSFEVDVWFKGHWLELMGCGMVHPTVLKNGDIDPTEFSGFAFGLGIDRITMLKHGIDDIRLFLSGNLDFLEEF